MIQTELLNNETLIKHWSDKYLMLLQKETGSKYPEPIDIIPRRYTYSEVVDEYIYDEFDEENYYNEGDRVVYCKLVYESLLNDNNELPWDPDSWKLIV